MQSCRNVAGGEHLTRTMERVVLHGFTQTEMRSTFYSFCRDEAPCGRETWYPAESI